MADIHDDFDKEVDLSKSFDSESSQQSSPQQDPASMTKSAVLGRAILQGAVPFEDRAVAAAKTGISSLQNVLGIDTGANVKPTYEENLQMMRQRNAASKEAHPSMDFAGKVAGGALQVAAMPEAVAEKIGLSGAPTLTNMARGGAALGAEQGLSETKDLTNLPQAAKDTATGAATGAITAPIFGSAFKGVGAGLDRIAKTKMIQSMMQAARVGKSGADVIGSEATADLSRQSESHIMDEFLPKVKAIEADLVGSTDPVTRQHIPGQYDALYETANQRLPEGISVQGLADRVQAYKDRIEGSSTLNAYYSPEDMSKIDGVLAALKERSGQAPPAIPEGMPEGMLPPAANATPMSVSELRSEMQNLQDGYSKSPQNNGVLLDLKKIYDAHLDDTLGNLGLSNIKDHLDSKYAKLQGVKDMLGIKRGMTGIEPQETARSVAQTFEDAAKSDPEALNDVAQAGQHLMSLDPEMAPVLSTMADNAEKLGVSRSVNKETPIAQGISKAHLSGHAITSNVGYMAGKGLRAVQDVIKGATNLTNTDPEVVDQMVGHLLSSENPVTKRMGGLLQQVVNEPDAGRRRALMFSLSQQPTFRQAIGNIVKDTMPENKDEGF